MSAKKVWSAPIALIVVVTALFFGGMTVLADTEPVAGGEFGDALTWTLDSEGTLNISGTGEMGINPPWLDYSNQIKTINIDNGVTDIGSYAFSDCSELTQVNIGTGVTRIGYASFINCTNLKNINIPETLTSLEAKSFYNCKSLESITIPDGVTEIKEYTFYGCKKLQTVNLPENLTYIGVEAFHKAGIITIDIPDFVTEIDNTAFAECPNLSSVTLPDSLTRIGRRVFAVCPSLKSIVIPEGVTEIGGAAFYYSGLETVNIPSSVESVEIQVFESCINLESITISEGLTYIPEECFYGCDSLKTIDIPESVEHIDINAFCYCGLESVTIPGNVKAINAYAFDSCQSLVYVELLSGVEVIDEYAFSYCSALQSVIIPASVTQIKDDAFLGCNMLKDVFFYGNSDIDWFDSKSDDFITPLISRTTLFHVTNDLVDIFRINHSDLNVTYVGDLDEIIARVTGHSITLSDEIGVNFYIYLPEGYDSSNVTVDFTWGEGIDARSGESYVHNVKGELVPVNRYGANYVVKCGVAARAMNDNIEMIVKCGDQELISDSYSVAKYMNYLSSNYSSDQNLMMLILSMASYGAASQNYFVYGDPKKTEEIVWNMERSYIDEYYDFIYGDFLPKVYSCDSSTLSLLNIEEDDLGISFYGASSLSTTQTKMRFYFRITDASKAALLKASFKGTQLKFKKRTIDGEKLLYIETPALTCVDFDQDMEITINGKIYTYSCFCYFQRLFDSDSSDGYYEVTIGQYAFAYYSKIYQEGLLNND